MIVFEGVKYFRMYQKQSSKYKKVIKKYPDLFKQLFTGELKILCLEEGNYYLDDNGNLYVEGEPESRIKKGVDYEII